MKRAETRPFSQLGQQRQNCNSHDGFSVVLLSCLFLSLVRASVPLPLSTVRWVEMEELDGSVEQEGFKGKKQQFPKQLKQQRCIECINRTL